MSGNREKKSSNGINIHHTGAFGGGVGVVVSWDAGAGAGTGTGFILFYGWIFFEKSKHKITL
jgi:hypothetical protein